MAVTRIGILGGSFDPPHAGHLMIAREAKERADLDTVLFIPAGEQWLKEGQDVAPATHRLAMTHLLVGSTPAFGVSDMEVTRPGPTYTVDTLQELRQDSPPGTEYFFILGEDSVADLTLWHNPQELVTLCRFIAMPRVDGTGRPDLTAAYDAIPGLRENVTILEDAPRMDVSSSSVRRMVESGDDLRGIVPDYIVKYITAHRLYGVGGAD
ncbi:MAG: nicotinate-nucleotide adenylyltransferase [Chloroflexi bacterium]|nr:nicotinate-nucleotide adenylyltransferase [Chloroflexota bacterium]